MMATTRDFRRRRQLESILLICGLVTMSIVIIVPMTAPKARAQVIHDVPSADEEDMIGPPYDINPAPGIVEWAPGVDHILTEPLFTVGPNIRLIIPALNYMGDPTTANEISMPLDGRIEVYGTMMTTNNGNPLDKTAFIRQNLLEPWDGIYFTPYANGTIDDCWIDGAVNGVQFMPDSNVMSPGVNASIFQEIMGGYGLVFDGARLNTNIINCTFIDTIWDAVPVLIQNCYANITGGLIEAHRPDFCGLDIVRSAVFAEGLTIDGGDQPGNNVLIEAPPPVPPIVGWWSTFSACTLRNASFGYPLINVLDGNRPRIVNCTLDTTGGAFSVWADDTGSPSRPEILNPTRDGPPGVWDNSFDNTTMKAISNSNISLEWFLDVYVRDGDGNPISGATVTPSYPSTPASIDTDMTGWARTFIVRELNILAGNPLNYDPFNITATWFFLTGYAVPEPTMNMSRTIIITIGLDLTPPEMNLPPTVVTTNTTATINWTVDEPATATVWYGIDDNLTTEVTGSSGSADQTVTLTNLEPGRVYTFVVNSTDSQNNKNSSYPTTYTFSTKVHIPLYQGWNMISVPPTNTETLLADVLSSIAGQYDAVQCYDPTDGLDPWKHYASNKLFGNDLDIMTDTMGVWIHMTSDAVLIPNQIVPFPSIFTAVPLHSGWNFVGYPSARARSVTEAMGTVVYDMVQTYDAATGTWLGYDPGSYSPDNLVNMETGRGYWIHVPSDTTWNLTYI